MDDGLYILQSLISKHGGYEYRIANLNKFKHKWKREEIKKLFKESKIYFNFEDVFEYGYQLIINRVELLGTSEGIQLIKVNWCFND